VEEAATRLAALLEEEAATVLVAYDEHGNYGHPDHIQVHRVGLRAAERAGTQRVFMATTNRDHLLAMADQAGAFGMEMPEEQRSMIAILGVPAARITTAVDVGSALDRKRGSMEAHSSQISDTSFFLSMPPEAFSAVWGIEWYIRVGLDAPPSPLEGSLLDSGG
jgi:LmbE family N-acetylglucosaminyl deacetylase